MRGIAVLVAAAGVCASGAGATQPRLHAEFGVVAFDLTPPAVAAKLAELGAGLVRGSCAWGDLEPLRGVYRWDCADRVVVPAARLGLRSYMTVTCTPAWAGSGGDCARMPSDVVDWYDFVSQFVAHYAGTDVILGVWNEPNLTLQGGAGAYALLFVNASHARDAANPFFALAGPETSHHALADGYFEAVVDTLTQWRAFAPQDVVAVHWYPDGPPLPDYLEQVHGMAGRNDVWLTETGIGVPDLAAQAHFYDDMISQVASSLRPPWWTHVIFYRLWDGQPCCTDAILNADFTSKPAFDAYRTRMVNLDRAGGRVSPPGASPPGP